MASVNKQFEPVAYMTSLGDWGSLGQPPLGCFGVSTTCFIKSTACITALESIVSGSRGTLSTACVFRSYTQLADVLSFVFKPNDHTWLYGGEKW